MDFNKVVGLGLMLVGLVVLVSFFGSLYPTASDALSTVGSAGQEWNTTSYENTTTYFNETRNDTQHFNTTITAPNLVRDNMQLESIFTGGVLTLILVAVFVILVLIGLFAYVQR